MAEKGRCQALRNLVKPERCPNKATKPDFEFCNVHKGYSDDLFYKYKRELHDYVVWSYRASGKKYEPKMYDMYAKQIGPELEKRLAEDYEKGKKQ